MTSVQFDAISKFGVSTASDHSPSSMNDVQSEDSSGNGVSYGFMREASVKH